MLHSRSLPLSCFLSVISPISGLTKQEQGSDAVYEKIQLLEAYYKTFKWSLLEASRPLKDSIGSELNDLQRIFVYCWDEYLNIVLE